MIVGGGEGGGGGGGMLVMIGSNQGQLPSYSETVDRGKRFDGGRPNTTQFNGDCLKESKSKKKNYLSQNLQILFFVFPFPFYSFTIFTKNFPLFVTLYHNWSSILNK